MICDYNFGNNSREAHLFSPGDRVCVVDTSLTKIGKATCLDLRFPELFPRVMGQGAEMFLVCSAWPYPRLEPWLMHNRVGAFENRCYPRFVKFVWHEPGPPGCRTQHGGGSVGDDACRRR